MNVGINNRASTINQIFVGVNNIARLVYQSGGGTPAFQLPEFTGNNAISGDELSGRIELYESGTLTLYPGTYDFFLVGGGSGSSWSTNYESDTAMHKGGGGGGYTRTEKGITISTRTEIGATVGGGGAAHGGSGSSTTIQDSAAVLNFTASGGVGKYGVIDPSDGGDGGSGGGAAGKSGSQGGNGGSDGSNGGYGNSGDAGTGQGTTTRMFGESESTLYAGGGGGGGGEGGGAGGQGGGGGDYQARVPGQGGSGIVIVRWNNT